MTSRRKRPRMVAVAISVSAVLVLALVAPTLASAQSMTGEELFGLGTFNAQSGSTCNADGTGTLNFSASGSAFGPYPGTFTETGTLTFGPRPGAGQLNTITSYSAQFDISGANGTVTGTKHIGNVTNPTPFGTFDFINQGECTQVFGFGTNYFIAGVCYTATTPSGTDSGFGVAAGASARIISPSNFFDEVPRLASQRLQNLQSRAAALATTTTPIAGRRAETAFARLAITARSPDEQ
jgi:hypothetical protein